MLKVQLIVLIRLSLYCVLGLARHFILTVPFSTQVYKWVPAGSNPVMDQHLIQGEVEILLVASCYGNRDKLRPDVPVTWLVCRLYLYQVFKAAMYDFYCL